MDFASKPNKQLRPADPSHCQAIFIIDGPSMTSNRDSVEGREHIYLFMEQGFRHRLLRWRVQFLQNDGVLLGTLMMSSTF